MKPEPKAPTIAAVVAYCDSIGWRIPAYAAANFINYHKWRKPDVLQSPDQWQDAAQKFCLDMPKWKRLARAVDLALSAE